LKKKDLYFVIVCQSSRKVYNVYICYARTTYMINLNVIIHGSTIVILRNGAQTHQDKCTTSSIPWLVSVA